MAFERFLKLPKDDYVYEYDYATGCVVEGIVSDSDEQSKDYYGLPMPHLYHSLSTAMCGSIKLQVWRNTRRVDTCSCFGDQCNINSFCTCQESGKTKN